MPTSNKRIWVYWNGTFSKITVRPQHDEDTPICLYTGSDTEEGWETRREFYWLDCYGTLRSEVVDDGVDCDGRLTHHWRGFVRGLAVHMPYAEEDRVFQGKPVLLPAWEKISAGQRDYSAKAAGY